MTDERLRDLYARGLTARAARGIPDVGDVSPDDLLALAEGTLPEERRLELFDVVMASEPLRRDFALARAAVVAARQGVSAAGDSGRDDAGTAAGDHAAVAAPPTPAAPLTDAALADAAQPADVIPFRQRPVANRRVAAPWWRRAMGPMAIAASLLLVVVVGRRYRPGVDDPRLTRGAEEGIALAAPAVVATPADARRFAWHPVPAAARYAFELVDADGNLLYQTTTTDTTVALPATVPLRPAVDYRWLVRASDAAATPLATAVRRLRLEAP
jgi:hypothetical protein